MVTPASTNRRRQFVSKLNRKISDFSLMKIRDTLYRNPITTSSIVICAIFFLRFLVGGFDPSYYIVVGEKKSVKDDFIHDLKTLKNGSGYDGQYFYRYAINPFNKDLKYGNKYGRYGIKIDTPIYRRGRLIYPLFAWVLAFGQEELIPYTLILVNILAFISLFVIFKEIVSIFKLPFYYLYIPFLIGGLYFSVARNLSDILGCTIFAWCYLLFIKEKYSWFLFSSTLLLLCKETYVIFLAPAYLILFRNNFNKNSSFDRYIRNALLLLPWGVLISWKYLLTILYPDITSALPRKLGGDFDFPFKGMYDSMMMEFSIAQSIKGVYILWGILLITVCLKGIFDKKLFQVNNWMYWLIWINVPLVTCFAKSIYIDMWGFMRILAPTYLCVFLFLIEEKIEIPRWLIGYSVLMVISIVAIVVLVV